MQSDSFSALYLFKYQSLRGDQSRLESLASEHDSDVIRELKEQLRRVTALCEQRGKWRARIGFRDVSSAAPHLDFTRLYTALSFTLFAELCVFWPYLVHHYTM